MKITRPKAKKRKRSAAWRTVRGSARDAGSGVGAVVVVGVVRTDDGWAYLKGRRWRTVSSQKKAMRRTAVLTDETVGKGRWRVRLPKAPPRGRLFLQAFAMDRALNVSTPVKVRQRLTS